MVIQFDNRHYIKEADSFSSNLANLKKITNTLKLFSGLIGLIVIGAILSPFLLLLIWKLTYDTKKILKEAKEQKSKLIDSIKNREFSFNEIDEIETTVTGISSKIESIAFAKISRPMVLNRLIRNLKSIYKEMCDMKSIIKDSYVYKTEDLGLNKEELKEYMDQFKDLEDIWGHESTKEDKEVVYNHKKQLLSA